MKKTLQTIAALLLVATTATAQHVFTMPDVSPLTGANGRQKVTAPVFGADSQTGMASALTAEVDRVALEQYRASHEGRMPMARSARRDPRQPDDATVYRFRGQNTFAGLADDNQTQICGLVGFNLQDANGEWKWQCDTLVSNDDLSPYAVPTPTAMLCYRPIATTAGAYTGAEITKFDKRTIQPVGEKLTVSFSGTMGIPFQGFCYDDVNGLAYAMSMGNTVNNVQPYYLNIVDTITGQLRNIGELCHFNGNDQYDNVNPRALFAHQGQLYAALSGGGYTGVWVARVNPLNATYEYVASFEGTGSSVYGQPIEYDPEAGVFYMNYYDFYVGTVYYSFTPEALLNPKDGVIATTKLLNAPTGFNWFYIDPALLPAPAKQLSPLGDLSIACDDEGQLLTIGLTTPTTLTDGSAAEGTLDVALYIDNVEAELFDLPATVGCGQRLDMMADVTPGLHYLRLELRSGMDGVEPLLSTTIMVCGKDVPAAPTNLKVSVNTQNVATITWNAPTTGRYPDFGGQYDGGTLTYRVVRNPDGLVISEGGTSRRVQDKALPEELAYYSYTVCAVTADGRQGATATTDQFTAGTYMAMPYENDLNSYNQILGWTVINANDDGTLATWQWNSYSHQFYGKNGSATSRNDDWLISPPFRMQKGKVYEFRAKLSGRSNLDFYLGTSQTVNGMTKLIGQLDPDHLMTNEPYSVFFTPDQDGTYFIGLRDYVFGEYTWYVDDIYVNEVTTTDAPAQASDVAYQAADKGELSATVSLTTPATSISGQPLSALSAVKVYDAVSGALVGENANVEPGRPVSIPVSAHQGFNYVRVVAESASGQGWPAQVRAFAGVDRPQMADVRMLWSEEDEGSVMLTYHVADHGVNGGYVDTDKVKYTIYQHFDEYPNFRPVASDITDNEIEVEMIDPSRTGQQQYVLAVSATSVEGESELKQVGVVLGKPYEMPYVEEFGRQGLHHAPYITYNSEDGTTGWVVDAGTFNGSVAAQNNDGYDLIMISNGTADGKASFCTPIIDFAKASNPLFHFWVYDLPGATKGGFVTIDAITNGADIVACADTVRLGQGNGWREVVFSLKSLVGKRAQVLLTAYMPNPAARIWADNWRIAEAAGNDLAVTGISRPYSPKNGQQAEVEVSVGNFGAETAADYSVLFTLNGEVVAEAEAAEALLPGQETTMRFPLNISSTMEEIIYSAELLYDDDDQDNNLSAEVELEPEQVELPAPSGLTLDADAATLSWTAPEPMDGREVLLDFEDQPAFSVADDICGWLNIDGNHAPTSYFVMYNGTYWPYVGQPHGFMTWSAAESGNATAAMWKEHQGQRCLISFGHYDLSADGYPISDDNDWFISPEVKGGTSFSFWMLSNGAGSTLEVLASQTDRDPAAFTTVLQRLDLVQTQTWQKVSVTLPASAKYVAIHIPVNLFGIMIDEIQYTAAQAPQLLGYNIYNGTQLVGTATELKAQIAQSGSYRVTARYDLGESVPTNALDFTNGIQSVASSQQQTQQVFDLQGRRLDGVRPGLNIVKRANGKTQKVIVK